MAKKNEATSENPNPNPYDLTQYEKVFVLLNPTAHAIQAHKDKVSFDQVKKRHYLTGRVVSLAVKKISDQTIKHYPLFQSIAFVTEADYKNFKSENKESLKEEYILNIFFSDIAFITLDFNSFDWK